MNKTSVLSEREFELINIIAGGISPNQRAISAETGMSLGLTNLLLRRLVTKGHLKVRQLNQKKVEYLLTPKGFAEKTRKSYHYTLKTVQSLVLIKRQIQQLFTQHASNGQNRIVLLGQGDLHDLAELAGKNLLPAGVEIIRRPTSDVVKEGKDTVVYVVGEGLVPNELGRVDLIKAICDLPSIK